MPKEERQIKEITDNDLDTGRDLVTENYQLEILTLKDKVDLRRFSRAFLKVDKLLKSIFTGKEDKFPKNSGFNREKTDLEENDTNKLFTALGALNLKNWIVTNYTTLMNNIKDNLNNSINTKLNHGGYGGTGQQLKNEIDTKFPLSEAWRLYGKELSDGTDIGLLNAKEPGNYYFRAHLNPKFRVANLEVRCLNVFGDHRRQTIYNYDDLTTYVRNTGVGGDQNGGWVVELNTNTVNQHYCPYRIGDILTTTIANNPAEWWANTAWEKIEHCFLYAHNSAGSRSGENTIYLNINHLPSHNHGGDYIRRRYADGEWDWHPSTIVTSMDGYYATSDNVGGGAGINNMPAYYTVHVWKRIA